MSESRFRLHTTLAESTWLSASCLLLALATGCQGDPDRAPKGPPENGSGRGAAETAQNTQNTPPVLDGTSWRIQAIDDASATARDNVDTLMFLKGKVTSKQAMAQGYKMAKYKMEDKKGHWLLTAEQLHKKDQTRRVWEAEIEGDTVEVTLKTFGASGEVTTQTSFTGKKTDKKVRLSKKRGKRSKKKAPKRKTKSG